MDTADFNAFDHALGENPNRAQGGFLHTQAQGLAQLSLDGLCGEVGLNLDLPAKDILGSQPTEHYQRIGRRRQAPAPAVTRRTWVRPRALGSHPEHAARVKIGQTSPARANRVDLDHGNHGVIAGHFGVEEMLHPHLPVRRNANVCGGAADIKGNDAGRARTLAGPNSADQARHRSGHEQVDRALGRAFGGRDPADRGHQVEPAPYAFVRDRPVEAADVPADLRTDIGVQADCAEAFVLPVLGKDLVPDG